MDQWLSVVELKWRVDGLGGAGGNILQMDTSVRSIGVMVSQVCTDVRTHQIVHMMCALYCMPVTHQ